MVTVNDSILSAQFDSVFPPQGSRSSLGPAIGSAAIEELCTYYTLNLQKAAWAIAVALEKREGTGVFKYPWLGYYRDDEMNAACYGPFRSQNARKLYAKYSLFKTADEVDEFFVAFSDALVFRTVATSIALTKDDTIWSLLNIGRADILGGNISSKNVRSKAAEYCYSMTMAFMLHHELAHIYRGHLETDGRPPSTALFQLQSMRDAGKSSVRSADIDYFYALEWDADEAAMDLMLMMFEGDTDPALAPENRGVFGIQARLRLWILAILIPLYGSFSQRFEYGASRLTGNASHPGELFRLRTIMLVMARFLRDRGKRSEWDSLVAFLFSLMELIEAHLGFPEDSSFLRVLRRLEAEADRPYDSRVPLAMSAEEHLSHLVPFVATVRRVGEPDTESREAWAIYSGSIKSFFDYANHFHIAQSLEFKLALRRHLRKLVSENLAHYSVPGCHQSFARSIE